MDIVRAPNAPNCISPPYCVSREKICGMKAASVSAFCGAGTCPATSNPSAMVNKLPATPLNSETFCVISAGDHSLFSGCPKIAPNPSGRGACETTAGVGVGIGIAIGAEGTDGVGTAVGLPKTSVLPVGTGAGGIVRTAAVCFNPVKTSGIVSSNSTFFCPVGRRAAMNNGAITFSGNSTGTSTCGDGIDPIGGFNHKRISPQVKFNRPTFMPASNRLTGNITSAKSHSPSAIS